MQMPELVGREPAPHSGCCRGVMQLRADTCRCARPSSRRAAHHAEQSPDRQFAPELEPWLEVRPCPAVHPDLPPYVGLPVADDERATAWVKVRLIQGECLADPQSGPPKHNDDPAQPQALRAIAGAARITATISSTVGGSG
jgi:hypothetical protein